MIREYRCVLGEEHRLHKPHWLSTSASLMMYTLGLGQSQKRGIGTHCRAGEREIVQTGERKTRRAREGEELKKQIEMHLRV